MDSTRCPSPRCGGSLILKADYLTHLRLNHSDESCNFACHTCGSIYLKFKSLESHWYRQHHQCRPKPMFKTVPQTVAATGGISTPDDQDPVAVLPPDNQDSDQVAALPPGHQDFHQVAALLPANQDFHQVAALLPANQDFHQVAALSPANQDFHQVAALSPANQDFHQVAALSPANQDFHQGAALSPANQDIHQVAALLPDNQESDQVAELPPDIRESDQVAAALPLDNQDSNKAPVLPLDNQDSNKASVLPLDNQDSNKASATPASSKENVRGKRPSEKSETTSDMTEKEYSYLEQDVDSESDSGEVGGVDEDIQQEENQNQKQSAVLSEKTKKGVDYLIAMKVECGVNKTQMKTVINETKTLLEYVFDSTIKKLGEAGCPVTNIDIDKMKKDVCGVFDQLSSSHLQEKHLYQQYDVIKPKFVQLDSVLMRRYTGKKRKTDILSRNFYYIPVLKVLEQLLRHPDYNTLTTQRVIDEDPNVLDCYMKGQFAAQNPILQKHPDALRPYLYQDDLEVCGALSSYASGKQKLAAFYLGLDNIHPKFRASLKTISLVVLCDAALVNKDPHGLDFVLDRINQDLRRLEQGVILNGEMTFGTLVGFTGDNLAAHLIAGFKCGFTANKFCRVCEAPLGDTHTLVREDPSLLRKVPEYERQVQEIKNAKTQKDRDALSTQYGINKECRLNSLQSFHALRGFPPDLMHDVLEGSVLRTVKNVLKYLIEEAKLFTLDWVNAAIEDFDYGYTERDDKPSRIKSDHLKQDGNIKQSAAQMWTLATTLPLILGPHIPPEDKHWKHFLKLLEICRIIFSNKIHKDMLPYLADLIASFLTYFIKFYGHLLPKEHFMTHYPRLILCYGNLGDFMCMRMEAVHQFLKHQTYSLGNYKNIAKSLAIRYQLRQALAWSKPLIKATSYGVVSRKKIQEVPYRSLISNTDEVLEVSWINTDGFLLKKEECYICVGTTPESRPMFARVMNLVVWPDLLLICKCVRTEYYDSHFTAYRITENEQYQCHKIGNIKGKRVFNAHFVKDSKYVYLKESVGESL